MSESLTHTQLGGVRRKGAAGEGETESGRPRAVTRVLARIAVATIYVGTLLAERLGGLIGMFLRPAPSRRVQQDSVLVIGTFHNVGWFRSHVRPLLRCRFVKTLVVVTDEPVCKLKGLRYACPPRVLSRLLGRQLARLIWVFRTALLYRSGTLMGYHIMPNALMCLIAARWLGRRAILQLTSGPVQLVDGGVRCGNRLLSLLGSPSPFLESRAFALVRRFDEVIVRGTKARAFLMDKSLHEAPQIVTGSVNVERLAPRAGPHDYDVVTVARLARGKGLERFLELVALLGRGERKILAGIVGGGPLRAHLESKAVELGVASQVVFHGRLEDVSEVLHRSRVFVLLSESEGVSISMLEAMAAGLPVVVTNVGDLSDFVTHGQNGFLVDPMEPNHGLDYVERLLRDEKFWAELSTRARDSVCRRASAEALGERWACILAGGGDRRRSSREHDLSDAPTQASQRAIRPPDAARKVHSQS